jgi:hypothetical protein
VARALQCPACSTRHGIDGVAPGATFACTGCGRTLRAPGAATVPAAPSADASAPTGTRAERRQAATAAPSTTAAGFGLPVRIGAWVIAVLLGGVISLYLARLVGLLSTNNLIDVITGTGSGRYLRMALLLPIWALVTTGIVTLLLDGGWRLLHRDAPAPARRPSRERTPASAATESDHVPAAARPSTGVPDRDGAQRPRRIPPRDTGA